nr:dATP/dGTP diphosphohydrolase domain-containing protein [Actinopolymorpha pittospori]
MVRDTEEGKPRFDLLLPLGVPYSAQLLTRIAEHMARGAVKYTDRNWEKAQGPEELARYKSSAHRHLMQWLAEDREEDHAAAVFFNLLAAETVRYKMTTKI